MPYSPSNWYWCVAGNASQVWCSARLMYVPTSDATYTSWLAAGNSPSHIGSAPELIEVMQDQVLPIAQVQGVAVQSTSTPAMNATYSYDADSGNKIAAIVAAISAGGQLPGGGSTFEWPDASGSFHALSAANVTALGIAILNYRYELNQYLVLAISGQAATLPATPLTIA